MQLLKMVFSQCMMVLLLVHPLTSARHVVTRSHFVQRSPLFLKTSPAHRDESYNGLETES